MRIRNLRLENYRGFRDITLDLDRPLTVLVGVNGSGKSSVLTAIATLCSAVLRSQLQGLTYLWQFDDVDLRVGHARLSIEADVRNGGAFHPLRIGYQIGWNHEPVLSVPPLRGLPFLPVFFVANRAVLHGTRAFVAPAAGFPLSRADITDALNPGEGNVAGFGSLFRWFKDREDVENETRVAKQDLSLEDPQLRSVRRAIAGMLPGYSGLRVQRDPLHMILRKGEETLAVDQLSDGEKLLLAMSADLARRLAIAYGDRDDPLAGEALVLIDEIELHLHPKWQREALVNLCRTFPGCQFIVTTHSPQVLSTVPSDSVVLLDDFQVVRPESPVEGRDSNAILREVFDVAERPSQARHDIRQVGEMLDRGELDEARGALVHLEKSLGRYDDEVIRLKTRLEFQEAPLADEHP